MTNKKFGMLLFLMLLFTFGAKAQLTTSVRINEVLVINEENLKKTSWMTTDTAIRGLSYTITLPVLWIWADAS